MGGCRVGYHFFGKGIFEQGEQARPVVCGVAAESFEQHVIRIVLRQRRFHFCRRRGHYFVGFLPYQLIAAEGAGETTVGKFEKGNRFFVIFKCRKSTHSTLRGFNEFQYRFSHDAECTFRADKKLFEVVAGVVFDNFFERRKDSAVS